MIKNYPKSLMALVCAIGMTFTACKKPNDVQPESEALEASSNSSVSLSTPASLVSGVSSSDFMLGINGHPLGDEAYKGVSADDQITLLQTMGMGIYRINVMTQSDGTCTVPKILNPLLQTADSKKVTLLPMLSTRTLDYNASEEISYENGKKLGGNFAAKYAANFKYYDLGNDLDLRTLLAGKDGRLQADYDQKLLRVVAAYLKGMNDGIKSNDPDAQTMISAGWLHWGFIQYCETYGVKFDILAYHWYSDMEEVALRSKSNYIPDITLKLNALFPGKPIWITETNSRPQNSGSYEEHQNNFLTGFIQKCKLNPTVKAVLIYELFNETYKSTAENNYGVTNWVLPFSKWSNKLIAKNLIEYKNNAGTAPVIIPAKPEIDPAKPEIDPLKPVVSPATVTNVNFATGKMGLTEKLGAQVVYYTDRSYKITSVPGLLANATLIKTSNDDKVSKLNKYASFDLSRSATVYIAYDPRATKLPAWLQSWKKVDYKLGIDDVKLSTFNLYSKDMPAGTVNLGGNLQGSAAGALCQYLVIVK